MKRFYLYSLKSDIEVVELGVTHFNLIIDPQDSRGYSGLCLLLQEDYQQEEQVREGERSIYYTRYT